MVFSWLFGEKKKQDGPDVSALMAQADEATNAKNAAKGEALCREVLAQAPDQADAWTMLGVNLIRRGIGDPKVRTEAVLAWMRSLALRPGDSRAADHLRAEIQFPEELVQPLLAHFADSAPACDDAAGVLVQIGPKARVALEATAQSGGPTAERARAALASLS